MRVRAPVAGVGINDADYPVTWKQDGKKLSCPFYKRWLSMIQRCYSKASLRRHPRYVGCSVNKDWVRFSGFRAWMVEQQWEGLELDKDLLIAGNMVYGPDTCVFIPSEINNLITGCSASRGALPIGATYQKRPLAMRNELSKPYMAHCGGDKWLGAFATAMDAHRAWQLEKATQIEAAIDKHAQVIAGPAAEALRNRVDQLRRDHANNIETKVN